MDNGPWLVVEDPQEDGEEPWDFDMAEPTFIEALQNRAVSWRVPFAHSGVGRPEDDSSSLVHVPLSDGERPLILGAWAVHFHGTHSRVGKVCDQLFHLHETPERGFFRARGTPEQLAERCAAWFETVLSRPVIRLERLNLQGGVYATSWAFADTAEQPAGSAKPDLGPLPPTGWRTFRVRHGHHRCVLVPAGPRGRRKGPHALLCPCCEPHPADSPADRPAPQQSRTAGGRRRFCSHHRR